jgi:hypothetical protein
VEEAIAATSRFRGDDYHHTIAWNRVVHGTAIASALESRMARWL